MADPWHADESFWRLMRPGMFGLERWEQAQIQVEGIVELLSPPEGAAVLDLPCGPGRHSLELARRGFRVTGVDITAAYLEEARQRAAEASLEIEFVEADMRTFTRPEAFDLAVNLYTSFGYFEDPSDDVKVARSFHASLRPGGRLVMEMVGKESLAAGFQPRDWHENEDGSLLLEDRKIVDGWQTIRNRWILIRDGTRHEWTLNLRLYSAAELITLLTDAGFAGVTAYGNLEGDPYDEDAKRLVIVATK